MGPGADAWGYPTERPLSRSPFLIVGGLYWVTALRKTGAEVKVYTKHQDLTQASKHHKQSRMRYSPLRRVSEPGGEVVLLLFLFLVLFLLLFLVLFLFLSLFLSLFLVLFLELGRREPVRVSCRVLGLGGRSRGVPAREGTRRDAARGANFLQQRETAFSFFWRPVRCKLQ